MYGATSYSGCVSSHVCPSTLPVTLECAIIIITVSWATCKFIFTQNDENTEYYNMSGFLQNEYRVAKLFLPAT